MADLLPREWRQVMLAAGPYTATWPVRGLVPEHLRLLPAPRNARGYCPLGVLAAAGLVRYAHEPQPAPDARCAARVLAEALGVSYDRRFYSAVREFVQDWDAGEIADLAAALGL
jgi:hypothetical protein